MKKRQDRNFTMNQVSLDPEQLKKHSAGPKLLKGKHKGEKRQSMNLDRAMTVLFNPDNNVEKQRKFDNTRYNKQFMHCLNSQRKKLISHRPKRQQLFYIFHLILNQRRFSYNTCYAIRYFFSCLACRGKRSLKNLKRAKQDVFLDRGIEKLSRDLDIVNLLDMVKGYHVMKQVLFSEDDRFLLQL